MSRTVGNTYGGEEEEHLSFTNLPRKVIKELTLGEEIDIQSKN
jgi:hypothetical protein